MEEDEETADDPAYHYGSVTLCGKDAKEHLWQESEMIYLENGNLWNGGMTEDDVLEAAKRLAGIIRGTDVYEEYLHQREKLRRQPELYQQVNAYRQKNFDIQNGTDGEELFDKMEAFEREYRTFRENPVVDDFLRAELAFCRMMQEMYVLLTAEVDFE